jgi:mannitol/fructose-specific phosphotransferase system IIA component (Ntr-type)
MPLREYCRLETVLCNLEAADKDDALRQMIDALAAAKAIPKAKAKEICKEVLDRERQASTGIGKGVGIPHARSAHAKQVALAIARIPGGIDFGAVDGERVRVVLLLVSPQARPEEHLAAMRSIVGMVRDPYHCKRLHGCETAQSFLDLVAELDGPKK